MSTERALFEVHGMWCASCARAVERQLQREPGVVESSVSLIGETAVVTWVAPRTSARALARSVQRLGYRLEPAHDADPQAAGLALETEIAALQRRIVVALVLGMWVMLPQWALYVQPEAMRGTPALVFGWIGWLLSLAIVFYAGRRFLLAGWRTARAGAPGMDSLVAAGALGALLLSAIELLHGRGDRLYLDTAVMLVTLLLIGRFIEAGVRARSGDAIRGLAAQAPATARVEGDGDGEGAKVAEVGVRALSVGAVVRIDPGAAVPADGVVIEGRSEVDRSWLSGESEPVLVALGDRVEAGSRNGSGRLRVRVDRAIGARHIDAIVATLREMLARKSHLHAIADGWSSRLLGLIVLAAPAAALLAWWQGAGGTDAAARALTVLVVTCPCALSVAVPLVLRSSARHAARLGALVQQPQAAEDGGRIDTVVLDKTGTLTTPQLELEGIRTATGPAAVSPQEALHLAARLAHAGTHPLAAALRRAAAEHGIEPGAFDGLVSDVIGAGIEGRAGDGAIWRLGRAGFAGSPPADDEAATGSDHDGPAALLQRDGRTLAEFRFRESLHPDASSCVGALQRQGLAVWLATGDRPAAALRCAAQLGIPGDRVRAGCSPQDKAGLLRQLRGEGRGVLFAGDGINDAPALAAATIGVAVHAAGPAQQGAAAVVMTRDALAALPALTRLLGQAARRARQNLGWALGYNLLAVPAAVLGWISPPVAVAAMVASSLSVTLNAVRPFDVRVATAP